MGRIGKEVAIRARAFGMQPIGYDVYWDQDFATKHGVERCQDMRDLFPRVDYLSLHTNLTPETRELICAETIKLLKPDAILLNCARGEIIHTADVAEALRSGALRGYGTDVLDEEPPSENHPLTHLPNCLVTPHIGSRTRESVQRQAVAAVTNLINAMRGEPPLAQVNPEVAVQRVVE